MQKEVLVTAKGVMNFAWLKSGLQRITPALKDESVTTGRKDTGPLNGEWVPRVGNTKRDGYQDVLIKIFVTKVCHRTV